MRKSLLEGTQFVHCSAITPQTHCSNSPEFQGHGLGVGSNAIIQCHKLWRETRGLTGTGQSAKEAWKPLPHLGSIKQQRVMGMEGQRLYPTQLDAF